MTEALEIVAVPLVTREQRRVLQATVTLAEPLPDTRLHLTCGDYHDVQPVLPLPAGTHRLRFTIPEVGQEVTCVAALEARSLRAEYTVAPARTWTLHAVAHSHLDIGYTDRQDHVLALHRQIIDTLPDLCAATADWDEDARFRWSVEAAYPLQQWLRSRPEHLHRRLATWIADGQIEITGAAMTMHNSAASVEGLCRQLYCARELGQYFGVPIKSAMQTDVEGYTWRLASLFAHAGLRYFSAALNHGRSQSAPVDPIALGLPWLFRWHGPDGRGPLVAYSAGYWFGRRHTVPEMEEDVCAAIRSLEEHDYPYRNVLFRCAHDNGAPDQGLCGAVRAWNETYASPRLRLSTVSDAFHALEAEVADAVPTLQADWPEWWVDGVGSAAREEGWNRRTHRLLPAAEKLHTLAAAHGASGHAPHEEIAWAWSAMNLFDEHTWCAMWPWLDATDGPTSGGLQWRWKAMQAQAALATSERLVEAGAYRLAGLVAPAPEALLTLVVLNPSSWARTDTVTFTLPPSLAVTTLVAEDLSSGEITPAQLVRREGDYQHVEGVGRTAATDALFLVRDVPAHGYTCVALRAESHERDTPVQIDELTMTTPFHRITLDPRTGTIVELHDLATGTQWVDPADGYGLNAFLREEYNALSGHCSLGFFVDGSRRGIVLDRAGSRAISIRQEAAGPVLWSMVIEAEAPGLSKLRQELRVYAGIPRIELVNSLRKPYTTTKEAGFFAFPFAREDSQISYSIMGASRTREMSSLPGSATTWFAVEDWVAVARPCGTLIWAAAEAPLVEFDQTKVPYAPYPPYSRSLHQWLPAPDRPATVPFEEGCLLFSYLFNNIWDTNFPAGQGGEISARYSITTAEGALAAGQGSHHAASLRDPLIAVPVTEAGAARMAPRGQFLQTDRDDVQILAIKPARRAGTIAIRFVVTSSTAGSVELALPGLAVEHAQLTTLVEDPVQACAVRGGAVVVPIEPQGVQTVVLTCHRR